MDKIAKPDELATELRRLLAYSQSSAPSRQVLASALTDLAERVAMPRFTMPRTTYLPPQARNKEPTIPEGTDLAIWTWEEGEKLYGIAFAGKQSKPLWHHSFRNEAARQRLIDETVKSRKSTLDYKNQRLQERKEFKHSLEKGSILYSSWGYDQTNVNFYEVTDTTEGTVTIREVASDTVKSDTSADYVTAVPGRYIGPAMKKRVSPGNSVKVDSSQNAYLWDGKPKYQTAWHAGH